MTKKMEEFLNQVIEGMPADQQSIYRELSDYCISLSLVPKKVNKKETTAIEFVNTKKKYAILRFGTDPQGIVFGLRYYASKQYDEKFHKAIWDIVESYKGEYVGCYHCGNCQGQYVYHHTDGKDYVRCGFAFVPIKDVTASDVPEIKRLIENQNTLYNQ